MAQPCIKAVYMYNKYIRKGECHLGEILSHRRTFSLLMDIPDTYSLMPVMSVSILSLTPKYKNQSICLSVCLLSISK